MPTFPWERFGSEPQGVRELWEIVGEGDFGLPLGRGSERSQRIRLGMLLKQARDRRFIIVVENGRAQPAGSAPHGGKAQRARDNGAGSLRTLNLKVEPAGARKPAAQWRLVRLGECGEPYECSSPPDAPERDGPLERNGEKSAPSRAGGNTRILHHHSPAGRGEDVKKDKNDKNYKKEKNDRKEKNDKKEDTRDVEEWF